MIETIFLILFIYSLFIVLRAGIAIYFVDQIYGDVEQKFKELFNRAKDDYIRSTFVHNFYCLDWNIKSGEVIMYIFNIFKPLNTDKWLSDDLKHFLYEV